MKNDQELIGALLKMERIKQNRSQKEVSYGICVPSYLSKIEYGTVKPDNEILEKLYKRLGISFVGDRQVYDKFAKKIEEYYYMIQYGLDTEELYSQLIKEDALLSYSKLAIDWLIIKGQREESIKDSLSLLRSNMTLKQKAYYQLLLVEMDTVDEIMIPEFEEAAQIINNSFAMVQLCIAYYLTGNYTNVHEIENKVIAMALEEGNTYQMAQYYFMNGSSYACINMEEMMMNNYIRGIHLLQNTAWNKELPGIYYNIGATYISLKKYDLALEYLQKAESGEEIKDFLTLQKIALAYIRSGDLKKGMEFLNRLEKEFSQEISENSLKHFMFLEAKWECRINFLEDPEFLDLMEKLMKKIQEESHFGFVYFYKDMITEAYMKQRKYKKALEFQQEISLKALNGECKRRKKREYFSS